MSPEKCQGFTILPPNEFYAISWDKWEQYMNATYTHETLEKTKDSTVVHLWNKNSFALKIDKSGPQTAYGAIAERNCPKVFEVSGEYF